MITYKNTAREWLAPLITPAWKLIPQEGALYRWQAEDLADRADAAEKEITKLRETLEKIERKADILSHGLMARLAIQKAEEIEGMAHDALNNKYD